MRGRETHFPLFVQHSTFNIAINAFLNTMNNAFLTGIPISLVKTSIALFLIDYSSAFAPVQLNSPTPPSTQQTTTQM